MPEPNTGPATWQVDLRKGSVRLSRLGSDQGLRFCSLAYTPRTMSEQIKGTLSQVVGVLQLIALIIGVAGMFTFIGKRDQQLTEVTTDLDKLASAVNDLAKAQASAAVNDAMHNKELVDIQRRLNEVERKFK
jgi:hypothetical protein